MRHLGYTRVSTRSQDAKLQVDALVKSGVQERDIFADVTSGSRTAISRPGMKKLLEYAKPGDTVVVWRVDRLGRSLIDVLNTVKLLRERDVQLKSVSDGIDPSTTSGRLMLNMLATLAEYERELITERVNAGITAARNGGTKFGRPLSDPVVVADKLKLVTEARAKGRTAEDAAKLVGWSRATLYRHQQALAARAGCPGCPRRASAARPCNGRPRRPPCSGPRGSSGRRRRQGSPCGPPGCPRSVPRP